MKRVVAMFLGLVLILGAATSCSKQTGQTTPPEPSADNSAAAGETGNPSSEPGYEPGKFKTNAESFFIKMDMVEARDKLLNALASK